MTRSHASRRGFLALLGSTALAGCSGFDPLSEDEQTRVEVSALREALSEEAPAVPETVPVDIERSHLERTAADLRETLSAVPAPFGERDVPNGAIRTELQRRYDRAETRLDEWTETESPLEALDRLRYARRSVYSVVGAWEAIESDLTFADVRERIPEVRASFDSFRERWGYVGDDRIRAVLVHATIEELVARAGGFLARVPDAERFHSDDVVSVGEFAGRVESARAAVADAAYLYHRFVASLSTTRSLGSVFRDIGESLTATLESRRESLPPESRDASSFVDRDVEDTPVGGALSDLRRAIDYADNVDDERERGQRASVVLSAHWTLARIRAFEFLRERVSNDEYVTVETVDDARLIRGRTVSAVEDALASDEHPRLTRHLLRVAEGLDYFPRRLDEYDADDTISLEWLADDLGEYVHIEATARASVETNADVADAIRRA
ncbi:hypothetical protein [Halogeometricum limi]|uniref:Uncharacterized protein n=1 Tax=Halogeometricum limi TaxID=555875 RepID=A0A1I6G1L9_9EURY|nr:hypothetical protein [Halogeometricum limi]SFR36040.1 hypothetical protein SAMN04488124_0715 [Halogeometricum limi]